MAIIERVRRGLRRAAGGLGLLAPPSDPPSLDAIPKELIAALLPVDPIIVEAGAHVGSDTVAMSARWPSAQIHAFEPVPRIYAKLAAATARCANVTTYPLALGARSGMVEMFVSGGTSDASSSLLAPKEHLRHHPSVTFTRRTVVESITLDDWAARHGVPRVDFMWLDMQGGELATLRAAPRMLAMTQVILTEVSLAELYEDAPLYDEVRGWLATQGFRVVREEIPWEHYGNVLFAR